MNDWTSKSEVTDSKRNAERGTEERIHEADEHHREIEETSQLLDEQGEPIFRETAEALNRIAREFEGDAVADMARQEAAVGEAVEREKREISDPSREGADRECEAARQLEGGVGSSGSFVEKLLAAAEVRSEASEFLAEVADGSDSHQRESAEKAERLSAEATRAAAGIKRF